MRRAAVFKFLLILCMGYTAVLTLAVVRYPWCEDSFAVAQWVCRVTKP